MRTIIATLALLLTAPTWVAAQNDDHPQPRAEGYAFFGVGAGADPRYPLILTESHISRPVVEHGGLGGEFFLYKGLALGPEVGYEHWGAFNQEAGIGSVDLFYHFRPRGSRGKFEPFLLGGYTLKFQPHYYPSGSNLGGGVNLWLSRHAALRLEFRDELGLGVSPSPNGWQQTPEFRAGVTFR